MPQRGRLEMIELLVVISIIALLIGHFSLRHPL